MKLLGLKIVALICAISLWFFVVSSRTYQIEMEIPLRLINLPKILAISSHVPKTVSVLLEGSGMDLIRAKQDDSFASMDLDLSKAPLGKKEFFLNASHFHTETSGLYFKGSPRLASLEIEIDTRITREIPIRLRTPLHPKESHLIIGPPVMVPPSISISGARSVLTKIYEINTSSEPVSDLDSPDTIQIPLASEALPSQVTLSIQSIRLAIDVQERFSVTFKDLPLQLVGAPPSGSFALSPARVSLTLSGGKTELAGISPADINIFIPLSRFQVEFTDSLPPTVTVRQRIESWSTNPKFIHLTNNPYSEQAR
jgi:YbbR domain-containing protein